MKLLKLLFKRCIEFLLVEVEEILPVAAAVRLPLNVFVGKIGHTHSDCRFRELACHKCGKIRHLAKICQSSKGDNTKPPRKKTVHHVEETVKDSPEDGDLYVIVLHPSCSRTRWTWKVMEKSCKWNSIRVLHCRLCQRRCSERIGQTWRYRRVKLHCIPTLVSPFQWLGS